MTTWERFQELLPHLWFEGRQMAVVLDNGCRYTLIFYRDRVSMLGSEEWSGPKIPNGSFLIDSGWLLEPLLISVWRGEDWAGELRLCKYIEDRSYPWYSAELVHVSLSRRMPIGEKVIGELEKLARLSGLPFPAIGEWISLGFATFRSVVGIRSGKRMPIIRKELVHLPGNPVAHNNRFEVWFGKVDAPLGVSLKKRDVVECGEVRIEPAEQMQSGKRNVVECRPDGYLMNHHSAVVFLHYEDGFPEGIRVIADRGVEIEAEIGKNAPSWEQACVVIKMPAALE